uniref:Uncharacterized protein n=1 Tax=Trypanosoma congolense (strain IL3000) TaxID=1068625 RepID=G0UP86_TRYCI|nr:hypothetical protein, unlikely [Trypanosoma congolense IL3000]
MGTHYEAVTNVFRHVGGGLALTAHQNWRQERNKVITGRAKSPLSLNRKNKYENRLLLSQRFNIPNRNRNEHTGMREASWPAQGTFHHSQSCRTQANSPSRGPR